MKPVRYLNYSWKEKKGFFKYCSHSPRRQKNICSPWLMGSFCTKTRTATGVKRRSPGWGALVHRWGLLPPIVSTENGAVGRDHIALQLDGSLQCLQTRNNRNLLSTISRWNSWMKNEWEFWRDGIGGIWTEHIVLKRLNWILLGFWISSNL